MKTLLQLKESLSECDFNILEELAEYYDDAEALLTAIADEDDELSDKVNEWADGQIDIYTYKVYEWIGKNTGSVADYEEEAINEMGAKTIESIGQYCQYRVAQEEANEAISNARKELEAE